MHARSEFVITSGDDRIPDSLSAAGPAIGTLLDGKYRLLARLGAGGMSVVYRAENVHTGKHVALKWLRPDHAGERGAMERMLREARAASSLRHPGVVDVYDVGRCGSAHFLVMELLEGETLRSFLRRSPAPTVPELIARLLPAFDGVAAAHDTHLVHRDLKPENIFLERVAGSEIERGKVLDFGVAKSLESTLVMTLTGTAVGTPSYMPLEQLRGDRDLDARADVYALGAILYEALAGRLPHEASTLTELAIKVATAVPAPLGSLRPDLPATLARTIDWALARERQQRLPSVRGFRDELGLFAREPDFRKQMLEPDATLPRLPDPQARKQRDLRELHMESAPFHDVAVAESGTVSVHAASRPHSRRRLQRVIGVMAVLGTVGIGVGVTMTPQSPMRGAAAAAVSTRAPTTVAVRLPEPARDTAEAAPVREPLELPSAPPTAAERRPVQPPVAARSNAERSSEAAKRATSPAAHPVEAKPDAGADESDKKPRVKRADIAQLLAF